MSDTTLGIVIGSGMTLAGVILQGFISWFLGWCKDVRDEERQRRFRREAAYREFINLYGAILAANGCAVASSNPAAQLPAANLYTQPNFMEKVAAVLSGVQLYGAPKIATMASSFVHDFANESFKQEPPTLDRIAAFDRRLSEIQVEVKDELGL